MAFVAGAQGFVDPVTDLSGILKQRRRWLNGSFFATLFYLTNMWADVLVGRTAHSRLRRVGFLFQWLYTWLTTFMMLTLLSNFYLTLHFAVHLSAPNTYISASCDWAYCGVFLAQTRRPILTKCCHLRAPLWMAIARACCGDDAEGRSPVAVRRHLQLALSGHICYGHVHVRMIA